MREKNYYTDTFQYGLYSYIDDRFKPKKNIAQRYGSNPCAEIVLETPKQPNKKLLLLV
jgi:hypothetical protein